MPLRHPFQSGSWFRKTLSRLFGEAVGLFILATSLVSAVLGVIYVAMLAWDWNTLAFATPQKEKAAATEQFLWSCHRHRLNPADFEGPYRDYSDNDVHTWVWSVKKDHEEHIAVHISYMPYEVSDTISTVLAEAHSGKAAAR